MKAEAEKVEATQIQESTGTESWTERLMGLFGNVHLGPELLIPPLILLLLASIVRARAKAKKKRKRVRRVVNPWRSL